MTLYCGIDLHSNNSLITLIDEDDRVISEKRLDNELESVDRFLLPFRQDIVGVVVESTYNCYWLVDGLMEKGYPVHLANTLAVPPISERRTISLALTASPLESVYARGLAIFFTTS